MIFYYKLITKNKINIMCHLLNEKHEVYLTKKKKNIYTSKQERK